MRIDRATGKILCSLLASGLFSSCAKIDELGSRFFKKEGTATAKGSITGLLGTNLTLSINGVTTVVSGSPVEFSTNFTNGDAYTISIAQQPLGPAQTCSFTSATTGVVTGGIIPFALTCSTGSYTVAGNVTGLSGSGLQVQLNGGQIVTVTGTSFAFTTAIIDRGAYNVQVKTQPTSPNQTCTPEFNTGIITGANVTNISVVCTINPYPVGGYVNGLASGASLVLQVNGGQNLTRTSDGFFIFPTNLSDQSHFDVTVLTQPTGQTCSVRDGAGIISGRGNYAAYVQCSNTSWSVSGNLSGLGSGYVTLVTSAGEFLPVTANGSFTFSRKFANASGFAVEVFRNPVLPAQTCTVSGGTGSNIIGDVSSVSVSCAATGYTIGGTVSNLSGSGLVLRLNGTSDLAVGVGSTSFTFAEAVAAGAAYSVTVAEQPAGLKCSVTSGTESGSVSTANVTNVAVTCQNGYTVSGTVTGLNGNNFVLRNTINSGVSSDFVISGNSFTFPELMVTGDTYSVQVLNHPESPYQSCGISNSGGMIASANISNITVTCTNVTVQFSVAAFNRDEASETIAIPITITPASARPLNINLALAAGTAASGVDFNFLTPTITVPVGATSVDAQIEVFQDATYEPSETVIINLMGVDKAALGSIVNHTHTINNDDGVTASKLVVTNAGSNFTAGGSTSITVQVQDASNNVATTDSSTVINFTPSTTDAIIASANPGSCTGCGTSGVKPVQVQFGVATIVINNSKAETFQISAASGVLTPPSPVTLTTSPGPATQLVISQAPGNTTAGGSTSMTVEVRDANNNVVTNATTAITFDPTLAGTISGVTTGNGDGSYGVAGAAETITVVGGVATITLSNTTAQTYSIAISNNAGFSNPAAPSVTVSAAAANQLVLSSPAADFLAGGTTSLTVQVRDTYGNVVTGDSTTEVTFTPSSNGRITNQTAGTFVSGDGSAGTARVVRVASGVATVTIENSVSETFTVSFAAGGLTVPSPDSITVSLGATQLAITQAPTSFIAGGSTTMTVQVQTASGTLVNTDTTTVITFDPTASGTVSGITTGSLSTGSTGTPGAPVGVLVNNGVATVTLTNAVIETFTVSVSSSPVLTPPTDASVTVTGASGAVLTKAEYFDIDHNSKIDRVKLTFDKNVDETTVTGYNASGTDVSTQFLIAGYSGVTMRHNQCIDESYPTNGDCVDAGELNDTTTNNIVWLQFTEGSLPDTGATPNITGVDVSLRTTAAGGSCYIHTTGGDCNTQSAADFGTAAVAEEDKAPPVYVTAWSDPIVDAWQLRIQFSEAVDLTSVVGCAGTVTSAAFTYNNVGGSGTSALRTDFADNNPCDSSGGYYYIIPRVNARFTMSDLRTDTLALATTFYDAVGLATVAATKTIQYDPNLELYYPIDAASPVSDTDALVHDVTANGRNGTRSGNAKLVKDMTDSNYQAYQFDGDGDSITVTGYNGVTGTTDRTISAWVWSDHGRYVGGTHNRCQIAIWGGGLTVYGMALNHESAIGQEGGLNLTVGGNLRNTSVRPAITGGWMHVAITWANDGTPDASDAVLYVNGVAQSVTSAGGAISTGNTNDMLLGRGFSAGDAEFRGKMDEVRLYSRALSAAEIKKLATKVPTGLVAQYNLDDNTTSTTSGAIKEQAGNGYDLTLTSGPAPDNDRYAVAGASYLFPGSGTGRLSRNLTGSVMPITGANRTVCAWANLGTVSGNDNMIVNYGTSAASSFFGLGFNSSRVPVIDYSVVSDTGVTAVALNAWSHICASYDGTNVRLYLNGMLDKTVARSLNTGTAKLNIGLEVNDSSGPFPGTIDDVRIYNRALSAGEITALATELDRGLVAYYPLDDAAATAKDYSGSGNDLTASGGPTYTTGYNGTASGAYNFVAASSQYLTRTGFTNLPTASTDRTMCAWKLRGAATGSWQMGIDYGTFANNNASGLAVNNSFVPSFGGRANDLVATLAAPQAAWYIHCVTMQSNAMKLYVNGNQEAAATMTGLNTGTTGLRLGASLNADAFFNGALDEVRIYNRALSLAEIRALSGFYPSHLSTLAIWYDASRIGISPPPGEGADVSLWNDISLNNRFADKSGSSSTKPKYRTNVINGLPTVRFTAADGQRMDINNFGRNLNTTAHTQLAAFRASGGAAGAITSQSSGHNIFLYNTGPVLQSQIGGTYRSANTAYVDNTFVIAGLSYSNPSGTFYRNGAADGTFSATAQSSTNAWRFGDASSALNGDVAELIIYDRVLTAAELEKVNCYYSKKYAIAVTGLVCE